MLVQDVSVLELQESIGTVKANIQQAKQDLRAAEATADEKAVDFQQKQLEQLREKELTLLRAQTAGQLSSLLSPTICKQNNLFRNCSKQAIPSFFGATFRPLSLVLSCSIS